MSAFLSGIFNNKSAQPHPGDPKGGEPENHYTALDSTIKQIPSDEYMGSSPFSGLYGIFNREETNAEESMETRLIKELLSSYGKTCAGTSVVGLAMASRDSIRYIYLTSIGALEPQQKSLAPIYSLLEEQCTEGVYKLEGVLSSITSVFPIWSQVAAPVGLGGHDYTRILLVYGDETVPKNYRMARNIHFPDK